MKYFVMSKVEGLFGTPEFARLLAHKWPDAQLEWITDPDDNYSLEFRVPMKHSRVDGALDREGSYVAFVGELVDCAEFAGWCRTLVPPHEPLIFCDEGLSARVNLEPRMTAPEILRAFHGASSGPGSAPA